MTGNILPMTEIINANGSDILNFVKARGRETLSSPIGAMAIKKVFTPSFDKKSYILPPKID
jgi:hypothetical protein